MDEVNLMDIVNKLSARLYYSESNGGKYEAVNGNALGKYQFIPKYHWKSIEKYAKDHHYTDAAAAEGKKVDKQYFLEHPSLQEGFFKQYVKDTIVPKLREVLPYNKRNLDIDEIAQLIHMNPASVKPYISGGEWKVPGKQTPLTEYLAKGQKGLSEKGLGPITKSDLMSPKEVKSSISDYFKKVDEIRSKRDSGEYSEDVSNIMLGTINRKYNDLGLTKKINNEIALKQADQRKEFESEKDNIKQIFDILSNPDQTHFEKKWYGKSKILSIEPSDGVGKAILQNIEKGIKSKNGGAIIEKPSNANPRIRFNFDGKTSKSIDHNNTKWFVDQINKYSGNDKPYTIKDFTNQEDTLDDTRFRIGNDNVPIIGSFIPKIIDNPTIKNIEFNKTIDPNKLYKEIDPSKYDTTKTKVLEGPINDDGTPVTTKKDEIKNEDGSTIDPNVTVDPDEDIQDPYQFYGELDKPQGFDYDKNDYKKELPFEAAAQGLLAHLGMEAARKKVPERDEKISAGFQDYIDQINDITKIGLPPELEAKAKKNIADSYQAMMTNIVASSGGNRNLVLGNQSQADLSRMEALGDLQIADYKTKVDALDKYGEAMKYVNEFNANRDIANKTMEQNMALQDRQAGGALAAQGFMGMMSALSKQRENAPGTFKHMLRSKFMADSLGYDPNKEDDGSGTVKGTKSYWEAEAGRINDYNEKVKSGRDLFSGFSDNKKKLFNEAVSKSDGSVDNMLSIAKVFQTADEKNIDTKHMDMASQQDDYSYLLNNRKAEPVKPQPSNYDDLYGKLILQ